MKVSVLGHYFSNGGEYQAQSAVAVVMPTVLRSTILRAVQSVFDQDFEGRVQLLIGIDKMFGPVEPLIALLRRAPENVSCLVLGLPFSTSSRHGGPHNPGDGGSLRAILTLMANARYVTYLDDDNRWRKNHLSKVVETVDGKVWGYSYRMLFDQETDTEIAIDQWDSVGPGKGRFADAGGFVDPNCLIIDKVKAVHTLGHWASTPDGRLGMSADRNFYAAISGYPHGSTNSVTVDYYVRRDNLIAAFMGQDLEFTEKLVLSD